MSAALWETSSKLCVGVSDSLRYEPSIAYVSAELELILLVLRWLDEDAGPHDDFSYELLADEVPDLNLVLVVLVLLNVDVDGETGYC
jgi:hypothetical protein